MSESPIFDPFRDKTVPIRPHPSPVSMAIFGLTTVSLKVAEDSPLCHKPREGVAGGRSSGGRFGAPSHSSFFCRNNPHPQRVRHIKGVSERAICAVNDVTFGQTPQYCLGRVVTPERHQCKIPTAAVGTNSTLLPIDVITGLELFPLRLADSPSLRLLTEAWRTELRDLTERTGLLGPTGRGSGGLPSTQAGCGSAAAGPRDGLKLQLMVIDILCQILQTDSIGDVQQWLLTAGQREKDQVLSLVCAALERDPASSNETPGLEQLTVKELSPGSRLASIREDDATRDQSLMLMSQSDSGKTEEGEPERPGSKAPRERRSAAPPPRALRVLSSPAACHLNQKVVLRYTKRSLSLTPHSPPEVFQAEWPNYAQQASF